MIKTQETSVGGNVEKEEPLCTLVEMQTGTHTVENSMKFLQKIKSRTAL